MSTVKTIDEWVKAGDHEILCPSGTRVKIRVPDLASIIEGGDLPQHLLDAALGVATKLTKGQPQGPTKEMIAQEREFTDFLVSITVTAPKLTPETAKQIPYEDKEMIVSIATRQRDLDAEGEHIAGLTKSEKFRRFRGLGEFNEDLEG